MPDQYKVTISHSRSTRNAPTRHDLTCPACRERCVRDVPRDHIGVTEVAIGVTEVAIGATEVAIGVTEGT